MSTQISKKTKPGLYTTELWVSLIAAAAAFVVGQGFISEEQTAAVVSAIGPVVAAFGYTISRGLAK